MTHSSVGDDSPKSELQSTRHSLQAAQRVGERLSLVVEAVRASSGQLTLSENDP